MVPVDCRGEPLVQAGQQAQQAHPAAQAVLVLPQRWDPAQVAVVVVASAAQAVQQVSTVPVEVVGLRT